MTLFARRASNRTTGSLRPLALSGPLAYHRLAGCETLAQRVLWFWQGMGVLLPIYKQT